MCYIRILGRKSLAHRDTRRTFAKLKTALRVRAATDDTFIKYNVGRNPLLHPVVQRTAVDEKKRTEHFTRGEFNKKIIIIILQTTLLGTYKQ